MTETWALTTPITAGPATLLKFIMPPEKAMALCMRRGPTTVAVIAILAGMMNGKPPPPKNENKKLMEFLVTERER